MFRDFHLIEGEGASVLFFPTSYRLFRLPAAQAEGVRAYLQGNGPLPPEVAPVIQEEVARAVATPVIRKPWGETDSLCLYVAHDCNFDCAYCYNDRGRVANPRMMMAPEVAEAAFRRFFVEPGRQYAVAFYGGEPLLNFRTVRKAVEIGRQLEAERGVKISFAITTNGTVLNREILAFLDAHFSSVTVSLDGPKEINDLYRRRAGGGSYDRIVGNIGRLRAQCKAKLTIKGTLAGAAVPFYTESLEHLRGLGTDGAILTPAGTPPDNPAAIGSEQFENFVRQHEALTEAAVDRALEEGGTEEAVNVVANLLTRRKLRRHCNAGRDLAVTADGSLYACHGLVGIPEFYMGKVTEADSEDCRCVRSTFADLEVDNIGECAGCWARYFCGGSCYAHAYFATGGVSRPDPRHCLLTKRCAEAAIRRFLSAVGEAEKRDRLYANVRKFIGAAGDVAHG